MVIIIVLDVTLHSSPSGPTYQTATWITFQCSATGGSDLYKFKWRVYCSSSGVLMYESLAGSDTTFRVKSTPPSCYDRVECVAEDTVLSLSGSYSITITSVRGELIARREQYQMHFFSLGVGIFANNNPVSNNSVVMADSNNQIGTIYCSSGSMSSNIGQWIAPNGQVVTQTDSLLTVVHGGGNFPGYVGLQLRPNRSLSVFDEGIYTCTIPDENGVQKILLIGLYRYGYHGMYITH